jgi:hypothetical protein
MSQGVADNAKDLFGEKLEPERNRVCSHMIVDGGVN